MLSGRANRSAVRLRVRVLVRVRVRVLVLVLVFVRVRVRVRVRVSVFSPCSSSSSAATPSTCGGKAGVPLGPRSCPVAPKKAWASDCPARLLSPGKVMGRRSRRVFCSKIPRKKSSSLDNEGAASCAASACRQHGGGPTGRKGGQGTGAGEETTAGHHIHTQILGSWVERTRRGYRPTWRRLSTSSSKARAEGIGYCSGCRSRLEISPSISASSRNVASAASRLPVLAWLIAR